jgi:hypothetical protein
LTALILSRRGRVDGTGDAGTEQPGAASDGNDGGHADANGVDVNHQGGANEK